MQMDKKSFNWLSLWPYGLLASVLAAKLSLQLFRTGNFNPFSWIAVLPYAVITHISPLFLIIGGACLHPWTGLPKATRWKAACVAWSITIFLMDWGSQLFQ